MANARTLRVTNVSTGESQTFFEHEVSIEIDGDGFVTIAVPGMGSREFLLSDDELEIAKAEVGL